MVPRSSTKEPGSPRKAAASETSGSAAPGVAPARAPTIDSTSARRAAEGMLGFQPRTYCVAAVQTRLRPTVAAILAPAEKTRPMPKVARPRTSMATSPQEPSPLTASSTWQTSETAVAMRAMVPSTPARAWPMMGIQPTTRASSPQTAAIAPAISATIFNVSRRSSSQESLSPSPSVVSWIFLAALSPASL